MHKVREHYSFMTSLYKALAYTLEVPRSRQQARQIHARTARRIHRGRLLRPCSVTLLVPAQGISKPVDGVCGTLIWHSTPGPLAASQLGIGLLWMAPLGPRRRLTLGRKPGHY